jgi:hypothetical protein
MQSISPGEVATMHFRSLALCALASAALVAACGDDDEDVTGVNNNSTATVRFVNATNTNISVANSGTVGTGNSALAFGINSSCMTVNTTSPSLSFTNSGTGAAVTGFTPSFATGGNYTVVAYTDASGNTQFATLNNSFTPTTGQAGIRVFNAASGSGNIVLNGTTGALNGGATTSFGNTGTFFSTPSGSSTLTFNTGAGTSTLASTGSVSLTAGQNSTVILGPAAAGSTSRRAFVSTGC